MEHYTSSIWESIYHYGSYTSFYGALFIYIGALFSLVERIIYLLLKDYYTFKTIFLHLGIPGQVNTTTLTFSHYSFLLLSLSSLPYSLSPLSSLGDQFMIIVINQVSHWW